MRDIPVDVSNVDNLAIGLFGTQSNTLTLAGSTVTGDVGLLGIGANATYDISVTGGSRIVGNLVHRGQAPANVNFDASAIVGDIRASNTDVVMQNGSTFEGVFRDRCRIDIEPDADRQHLEHDRELQRHQSYSTTRA